MSNANINQMGWAFQFAPTGAFALEANKIFETYQSALNFVQTDPTAYVGSVISVTGDNNEKYNGVYYIASTGSEGVLVKAGTGEGSITADSYSGAIELATDDNIGQIIYVTTKSTYEETEYSEGPYMVSGNGTLIKLGTTSPSGDLAGDVAALQTAVSELESNKVDKVEDSRLMTNTEGNKLAGVAEGAQVNVIETVQVDGSDLTVTDKTVNIDLSGKVDKVAGKSLVDDTEITKLAGVAEGAQVNVIESVKVDGTALTVTDKVVDIDLSGKVDKVDGSRLMTDTEGTKLAGIAEGAQVNVIETVQVDGNDLTITDKVVNIDLSGKVDKVDGSRLMTDTEGTKLAGIDEGAQVNVIETVKVNGTALEINGKAVDITVPAAPFQSVADGDKVLTLADGVLSSTLSFGIDTAVREDGKKYLYVTGIDGVEIGKVDTADFVVDGMLESVTVKEENPNILVFTWNSDSGKTVTEIDFSKYVDVYKADGTTLELDSTTNTFKVKDNVFDAYGSAATALSEAKTYTDDSITATVGNYSTTAEDGTITEATGLRAEIESRDKQVLIDANSHADQGDIDAILLANTYTDDSIGAYGNDSGDSSDSSVAGYGLRGEIEERDAQVFYDAVTYADGLNNAIDERVKTLEAIDHDAYISADTEVLSEAKTYTDTTIGNYSTIAEDGTITEATGLRAEIEENERVTANALTDLDSRVKLLEEIDHDEYIDYVNQVIGEYSSEGVDATGLRAEIEDLSNLVSNDYVAKNSVSESTSVYFDESGIIEVRAITEEELNSIFNS